MTPEQAQALYWAGEQAVVERLCALDAQVQAAQQQIEALQRKLASPVWCRHPAAQLLGRVGDVHAVERRAAAL